MPEFERVSAAVAQAIERATRQGRLFWTRERLDELEELTCEGRPEGKIAAHFGISRQALSEVRRRHGLLRRDRVWLHQTRVGRLLGIDPSVVGRWCELKWLRGRRTPFAMEVPRAERQRRRYVRWEIHEEWLLDFLRAPEHWGRWRLERISEAWLRDWAKEVRADWDAERWSGIPAIARRFAVVEQTVRDWIERGRLPAVRSGRGWLVREQDLQQFQVPSLGPRDTRNCGRLWTDEESAELLVQWHAGARWSELRGRFDCSEEAIQRRLRVLLGPEADLSRPIGRRKGIANADGSLRRFTSEEDARLLHLRGQGQSWSRIAAALGRAMGSVVNRHCRLSAQRASEEVAS